MPLPCFRGPSHVHAALNNAVAAEFGKVASYAPLTTSNLISEVSGITVDEMEVKEGRDFLVITEASVLEQLSTMLRCSIGTLGGGWAAAARYGPTGCMCAHVLTAAELIVNMY